MDNNTNPLVSGFVDIAAVMARYAGDQSDETLNEALGEIEDIIKKAKHDRTIQLRAAQKAENARVYGNAWVYGNAEVYGNRLKN